MTNKNYTLIFREADRSIFEAIKDGRKKVETRAATTKYQSIKRGEALIFICGKSSFQKKVSRAEIFKTIDDLLKKYKVSDIHPDLKFKEELEKLYFSFSGYREKIKKYGLIALELK